MAWNGAGTYVLNPSYSPEVAGTTIDPARYNGLTTDLAGGITAALAKNGENVPTANLSMGGFKHTGVAPATGTGQYLSYNQTGAVLTDLTVTTLTWSGLTAGIASYLTVPGPIGGTTPNTGAFTTLVASNGAGVAALNASNLASGTVPDARFPATLPAVSGVNLTALNATNLGSGIIPNARFPATLPATSAANLTSIPAGQLTGNIPQAALTAQFLAIAAPTGNQRMSSEVYFQWGNTTVGPNTVINASLATAFPNAFFQAYASVDDTNDSNDARVGAGGASLSQISLQNAGGQSRIIRWFAIGN